MGIFRFRTKEEAEKMLQLSYQGASASPAIYRELGEYIRLRDKYPFSGQVLPGRVRSRKYV